MSGSFEGDGGGRVLWVFLEVKSHLRRKGRKDRGRRRDMKAVLRTEE